MRLFRILVVLAAASVPAVVTLIGCGVQGDKYAGLPNEVPNTGDNSQPSASSSSSSGSTSSSSSSSSSTTSSSGGGMVNDCQCALGILTTIDAGPCNACGKGAIMANGPCAQESTNCLSDPNCPTVFNCVVGCTSPALWDTCVSGCIGQSSLYQALVACQCAQCQVECNQVPAVACDIDAGAADAPSDG